jgi:phosphoribosyl-AMP cyclohydrolase
MNVELEEGTALAVDFLKLKRVARLATDVIPVVVQDATTLTVLMVCYMDTTALEYTLQHHSAAFWSTSRDCLHIKGATSGEWLKVVDIRINCEQNSLLLCVECLGSGACHTKEPTGGFRRTCFYRRLKKDGLEMID